MPRYDRGALAAGAVVAGPALIEDEWSTTLVYPGQRCRGRRLGNLVLDSRPPVSRRPPPSARHPRGRPQRALRDRRGDERDRHALGALAAPQGGGRPLLRADRRRGPAHRAGPRHPDPHGRDGLHGEGVPQARARRERCATATSGSSTCPRSAATTCPTSRRCARSSSSGRLRRVRDQPRALGRHRRRRAGQLRAVGDRVLPGRAADRADPALLGGGARAPDASTSCSRTCAAARSARATSSPSSRPTTSPRAGSASCSTRYGAETIDGLLRAPARRVRGADARGASARCPTASGRARTGSTTTAWTTGRSASRARRDRGATRPRSTSPAPRRRRAGP